MGYDELQYDLVADQIILEPVFAWIVRASRPVDIGTCGICLYVDTLDDDIMGWIGIHMLLSVDAESSGSVEGVGAGNVG